MLHAQQTVNNASIEGFDDDSTGAALAGARVVAHNAATGMDSAVLASGTGRFHLPYPEGMISAGSLAPLLDHNIQGGVLKIGGTAFPAGIGTHAPSKIAFDLGGKINRFSCLVGLDQVSPNSAGVVYSVLADGREIFRSPKLRSDADPLPIDVSVAGAKELVLFADNCEFGDMGSSVDWVDLKFNK